MTSKDELEAPEAYEAAMRRICQTHADGLDWDHFPVGKPNALKITPPVGTTRGRSSAAGASIPR